MGCLIVSAPDKNEILIFCSKKWCLLFFNNEKKQQTVTLGLLLTHEIFYTLEADHQAAILIQRTTWKQNDIMLHFSPRKQTAAPWNSILWRKKLKPDDHKRKPFTRNVAYHYICALFIIRLRTLCVLEDFFKLKAWIWGCRYLSLMHKISWCVSSC